MTALRDVGGANALVRAQNIIDDPAGMAALQKLKEKIRKHPFFGTPIYSHLHLALVDYIVDKCRPMVLATQCGECAFQFIVTSADKVATYLRRNVEPITEVLVDGRFCRLVADIDDYYDQPVPVEQRLECAFTWIDACNQVLTRQLGIETKREDWMVDDTSRFVKKKGKHKVSLHLRSLRFCTPSLKRQSGFWLDVFRELTPAQRKGFDTNIYSINRNFRLAFVHKWDDPTKTKPTIIWPKQTNGLHVKGELIRQSFLSMPREDDPIFNCDIVPKNVLFANLTKEVADITVDIKVKKQKAARLPRDVDKMDNTEETKRVAKADNERRIVVEDKEYIKYVEGLLSQPVVNETEAIMNVDSFEDTMVFHGELQADGVFLRHVRRKWCPCGPHKKDDDETFSNNATLRIKNTCLVYTCFSQSCAGKPVIVGPAVPLAETDFGDVPVSYKILGKGDASHAEPLEKMTWVEGARVHIVQAPLGAGKTTFYIQTLKSYATQDIDDSSACVILPRVLLVNNVFEKIQQKPELVNYCAYTDTEVQFGHEDKDERYSALSKIVVTPESLYKLATSSRFHGEGDVEPYNTLVIDEFSVVMQGLASGNTHRDGRHYTNLRILKHLIRRCLRVFIVDADFTCHPGNMAFLRSILRDEQMQVYNCSPHHHTRHIHAVLNGKPYEDVARRIQRGEKLFVACETVEQSKQMWKETARSMGDEDQRRIANHAIVRWGTDQSKKMLDRYEELNMKLLDEIFDESEDGKHNMKDEERTELAEFSQVFQDAFTKNYETMLLVNSKMSQAEREEFKNPNKSFPRFKLISSTSTAAYGISFDTMGTFSVVGAGGTGNGPTMATFIQQTARIRNPISTTIEYYMAKLGGEEKKKKATPKKAKKPAENAQAEQQVEQPVPMEVEQKVPEDDVDPIDQQFFVEAPRPLKRPQEQVAPREPKRAKVEQDPPQEPKAEKKPTSIIQDMKRKIEDQAILHEKEYIQHLKNREEWDRLRGTPYDDKEVEPLIALMMSWEAYYRQISRSYPLMALARSCVHHGYKLTVTVLPKEKKDHPEPKKKILLPDEKNWKDLLNIVYEEHKKRGHETLYDTMHEISGEFFKHNQRGPDADHIRLANGSELQLGRFCEVAKRWCHNEVYLKYISHSEKVMDFLVRHKFHITALNNYDKTEAELKVLDVVASPHASGRWTPLSILLPAVKVVLGHVGIDITNGKQQTFLLDDLMMKRPLLQPHLLTLCTCLGTKYDDSNPRLLAGTLERVVAKIFGAEFSAGVVMKDGVTLTKRNGGTNDKKGRFVDHPGVEVAYDKDKEKSTEIILTEWAKSSKK